MAASRAPDYSNAAWFKTSGGDLVFTQWLMNRCCSFSDFITVLSIEACSTLYSWFKLRQRIRHELGLNSSVSVVNEEVHTPSWSVDDILEEMSDQLRMLRWDIENDSREFTPLEKLVVAEVIKSATELLISRATQEDEAALEEWTNLFINEGSGSWLWMGEARTAGDQAIERVDSFLALVLEIDARQEMEIPEDSQDLWASEIDEIEKLDVEEEDKLRRVAELIEETLHGKWPKCKVAVFGSSYSHFGSPDSDLDLSLMTDRWKSDDVFPDEVLGFYYRKRMMERKVWDDDYVATSLSDKTDKLMKINTQANAALGKLFKKDGSEAIRYGGFFKLAFNELMEALADELDRISREAQRNGESVSALRSIQEEKLLMTNKHRKNDLFTLKTILEEQGNEILAVVSHARVPILRFRYTQYGLDYKCDLCFDNELGLLNTRLLRAYASFDDRARNLGVAVKFWAKQRGISDSASGCLSSYSFVLMSIYYLQRVKVLPNLQEAQLVQLSKSKTKYYQQDGISFCEKQEIARLYLKNTTLEGGALDKSLSALVLGFFQFYATQFDCVNHVVAIRSPFTSVKKVEQWGTKAKTWRLSIQDPIQTSRDVGGVLHFSGQQKLTYELRRAFELLEDGESYLDAVCFKS
ncbi:Poly(A) RNA polymerase cid11 [Phytophthora citrophthora]|uniref:Poly(A) RNA polymerase cid11 n=1 Tax=Phytophthora citrophthora TaxID=4793 RepID=A0AAD9G130_9STRA|nr:Poly(A) RNA polymerase cid11 [Phytophthora citrophthora]